MAADEPQLPGWNPDPAALVAHAWVHLQRHDLREARSYLKQADALGVSADKLIGAVASLAAANSALAEGRTAAAAQIISGARSGGPVPAWVDQQLSLVEARAFGCGRRPPGCNTSRSRTGRRRNLAGGCNHPRTCLGDGRGRR